MSKKKDTVKENIKRLKKTIKKTMKTLDTKEVTEKEYNKMRKEINLCAVESICGMKLTMGKKKKKETKIKFYKKASSKQVFEIMDLINNYASYEAELFEEANKLKGEDEIDLDLAFPDNDDINIKKVNMKKFINALIGVKGSSILEKKLTGCNLVKLKALSDEVRKDVKKKKRIIIGGIVILISAAVITGGVVIANKMGKDDDVEDIDLDEFNDDNIDIDDVPHVDI